MRHNGGSAVGAGLGAAVGAGTGYGPGKGALIGAGVGAAAGAIYDITKHEKWQGIPMKIRIWLATGILTGLLMLNVSVFAQNKPKCDEQGKVKTPERVAGLVLKVDPDQGKLTLRESNGTVHEFQASKDALMEMKVGDRIEATLREAPKCP